MKFSILLVVVGFSHSSWSGCLDSVPKDPAFDFAKVILTESDPAAFKISQLRQACAILNLSYNELLSDGRRVHAQRILKNTYSVKSSKNVYFKADMIVDHASIAGKLGDTPIEEKYMNEIERIKKIKDPMERLKQVYSLSHQYQGRYAADPEEQAKYPLVPTPSKTLTMAAETGTGGVCRHFASLLNWSINQVSRGPSGKKDFSSSFEIADVHALVSVTLAPKTNSRWDWGQTFSLDPTNFDEFNPIPAFDVISPDSVINTRRDTCEEILNCYSSKMETAQQIQRAPSTPTSR